jgi:cyclohexyl-isocyanide hydratase
MSPFNVGFVIFPELTQLDFTGPQQVLARLPQSAMHIIAKTTEPVPSDSGLSLVPTHTFENSPPMTHPLPVCVVASPRPPVPPAPAVGA